MRAFVTGPGGFLGRAIVDRLLARGDTVSGLSRGDYPDLVARGVELHRGEVDDPAAVRSAAAGADVAFHVAAKAGVWGPEAEYRRVNVEGTRVVIDACRALGISRLVHTSTPSVVFHGGDMAGVDESTPIAAHFDAPYPKTKAEAERLVLAANGADLATVALRPHLIWGPGDNHLIPRLIARARAGTLLRVGDGSNVVDATYIDNAADAHLRAADRLFPFSPPAGRPYFIAQGEPLPLWTLVDRILAAAGLPPVSRSISPRLALLAGTLLESLHRTFRPGVEPKMTRFVARELSTSHWFDLTAARRDLGYSPQVSLSEGLARLAAHLNPTTREHS